MVWRADVVGAQGSSKHAYWVRDQGTLPAGGCKQAEPALAIRCQWTPSRVAGVQSCKHRPILCHLSQAANDRHPSTHGAVSFWRQLVRKQLGLTHSESSAHYTHQTLSLDGCESRDTAYHGVHQRHPLRSVQDSASQLRTHQELTPSPVVILILNAMCILSEDRFLARSTLNPAGSDMTPLAARDAGLVVLSLANLARGAGAGDMNAI